MRKYISRIKKRAIENWRLLTDHRYTLNYKNQGMINFIDVGSIGGLPDPWRTNANLVRFLLNFEPNLSPNRGPNHMTHNTAVWETEETLPFYIYKGFNATGSSLFQQNYEYVRSNYEVLRKRGPVHLAETWFDRSELVETRQLRCRPIDRILEDELPSTSFHFMKIDAQGAEYHILKGSRSLLSSSCVGLYLELFTLPLYKGIVLLDGVVAFLADFGFRMIKKFPPHGSFDSQHNCLFLKDGGDPQLCALIRGIYGIDEKARDGTSR